MIDGGRGVCNAVYVDDVCDAIMAALDRDDAVGAVGAAFLINGDCRITWRDFITTFAGMVEGAKTIHDHSLDEIAAYWQAKRARATASLRRCGSPPLRPSMHNSAPSRRSAS